MKEYNADQKDIDEAFKTIYPTLLTSSSAAFDSFHQVEDTDYKNINLTESEQHQPYFRLNNLDLMLQDGRLGH
jgi:hypothetical protein